jgi:hypothetical protein
LRISSFRSYIPPRLYGARGPEAPQAWMILMQGAAEKDAGASAVGLRAMLGKIAESEMPWASVVARRDKLEGRSHVV